MEQGYPYLLLVEMFEAQNAHAHCGHSLGMVCFRTDTTGDVRLEGNAVDHGTTSSFVESGLRFMSRGRAVCDAFR